MPFIPKPSNERRKEYHNTIDIIIGFTIEGPNFQSTQILDEDRRIDIPRPYILHDLKKEKITKYEKNETEELNRSKLIMTEELLKTIYLEFLGENTTGPYKRTLDFYTKANETLRGLVLKIQEEEHSIKASFVIYPCSYKDRKSHAYSNYIFFRTEKDSKYIITPHIQEI